MVYKWIDTARRLVLPPVCSLCGGHGQGDLDLCGACLAELPFNHRACRRCAAPLQDSEAPLCGHCLGGHWFFDAAVAPLLYQPPVSALITAVKFRRQLAPVRLLGELAVRVIAQRRAALPQTLIPVPLHPSRLRQRGYNQALEFGRVLSRKLDIPLCKHACHRRRATVAQSGMSARQRRRNVRNAFVVDSEQVWDHVAIIDDVLTTGHTVNELARVLRVAGVKHIEVWCVARTPPHD